ncbi:MAG: polymer-forming cytoskeletal protein [Candidatus Firestonebacteria bacterium]|nr:polymer-forming cytoskeletal protein [Candidatus Firestonebacteria bacterium]
MALFNNKKHDTGSDSPYKIDCILDTDTVFTGELESIGSIIVNGVLRGKKVIAKGNLIIGETGFIEANVEAHDLKISGTINGNIQCKNKIEITDKGKLYGNIHSERLQIIEGGIFEGACAMGVIKEEIKPPLELENVVPLKK